MELGPIRAALRQLLNPNLPRDAYAYYYGLLHPEERTHITILGENERLGYAIRSMTGMDLFRPVVALDIWTTDPALRLDFMSEVLESIGPHILNITPIIEPNAAAHLDVASRREIAVLVLDERLFKPVVNVLVREEKSLAGRSRYAIRAPAGKAANGETLALAGLNWITPSFADLFVQTNPKARRKGYAQSVAAAMIGNVLEGGRQPLYSVETANVASLQLAEGLGFRDIGLRQIWLEASWRG